MADAEQPTFGGKPIRSLDTFGVAGFLAEKSKVFYGSIFTTKHLGRVSDLIAAKLQGEGLDELRLRALLLFGTFEVFRSQEGSTEATSQQRLAEPLVIECGLDDDRVVIGISFTTGETRFPEFEGLVERVLSGKAQGVFETLLTGIHAHSHATYVREQKAIRRVEIVALLGIPGKADPGVFSEKAPLRLVEIQKEQKADPPKVKAYVELGDLDYPELLKDGPAGPSLSAPATGEVLMHGLKEVDDAIKVRAANLLEAIATKVGGTEDLGNGMVRVKGQGEADDGVFKVTAGGAIQAAEGAQIFKGDAASTGNAYEMKSYAIPGSVAPAEVGVAAAVPVAVVPAGEPAAQVDTDSSNRLREVLEKVRNAWPFRFGKKQPEPEPAPASPAPVEPAKTEVKEPLKEAAAVKDAAPADDASATVQSAKPIVISAADIAKEAQKLTHEIETGIEKTVNRAQSEAGELKQEMGSNRAKRWVDGLMSELVTEKARLAEASKALNASIKQKEIEFRTKEQILTEELRRRDDMIRQKTNAMSRLKDQLTQATMSAERLKSAAKAGGDDAHYKQKYGMTQKMLNSAKEENADLVSKIDDLKNQLLTVQSSKRAGPSPADFSALQAKYERSMRQADEFKKANQQLIEKLGEAKKERLAGSQDDAKKRLEAAMKMAAGAQRDAEKLQIRVEEMQREHMRLQAELNKTTQELKSARAGKGTSRLGMPSAAPVTVVTPGKAAATSGAGAAKPVASTAAKPAVAAAAAAAKPATAKPAVATKPPVGTGGKGNPPKAA